MPAGVLMEVIQQRGKAECVGDRILCTGSGVGLHVTSSSVTTGGRQRVGGGGAVGAWGSSLS